MSSSSPADSPQSSEKVVKVECVEEVDVVAAEELKRQPTWKEYAELLEQVGILQEQAKHEEELIERVSELEKEEDSVNEKLHHILSLFNNSSSTPSTSESPHNPNTRLTHRNAVFTAAKPVPRVSLRGAPGPSKVTFVSTRSNFPLVRTDRPSLAPPSNSEIQTRITASWKKAKENQITNSYFKSNEDYKKLLKENITLRNTICDMMKNQNSLQLEINQLKTQLQDQSKSEYHRLEKQLEQQVVENGLMLEKYMEIRKDRDRIRGLLYHVKKRFKLPLGRGSMKQLEELVAARTSDDETL